MKKRRRLVGLVLWVIFILLVAGVFYISFHNGEKSKLEGKQLLATFSGITGSGSPKSQREIDNLIYILRQSGRVLVFFVIGIVGTATIYVTFERWGWVLKTVLAAVILWAIACFTERMKIYIPTRHYSFEEMILSVAAVSAGLLTVCFVMILIGIIRRLNRVKKYD